MHAKDTIYSPDGAKDEQGNPVIRYEKDDLVATLVTDTEGKAVVNNLPLGSYYMKETIAGDHFVLNPEQKEFTLTPRRRGFHLVTEEIIRNLPPLPSAGILHLFIKHTSAGLTINENADPDVQTDMEAIFNRLVKEREPYYQHTCEGDDDMPAHAKATLSGTSLTIPITNGRLNIGIWQGIYLCEFRNRGGGRRIVATVIG